MCPFEVSPLRVALYVAMSSAVVFGTMLAVAALAYLAWRSIGGLVSSVARRWRSQYRVERGRR